MDLDPLIRITAELSSQSEERWHCNHPMTLDCKAVHASQIEKMLDACMCLSPYHQMQSKL